MATVKANLSGPQQLTVTTAVTLRTTAANEIDVIFVIWVSNPSASAVSFSFSIGADGVTTRIVGTNTVANIPANSVVPFYGPWIIPASTVITATAGTANVLTVTVTGEIRTPG